MINLQGIIECTKTSIKDIRMRALKKTRLGVNRLQQRKGMQWPV
jgi:hypothetical protein